MAATNEALGATELLDIALRVAEATEDEARACLQDTLQLAVDLLGSDRAVLHQITEGTSLTAVQEALRSGVVSNLGAIYWRSEIPTAFDEVLARRPVLIHVGDPRAGIDESLVQILAEERTSHSYGVPLGGEQDPTHVMTVSFSQDTQEPSETVLAWIRRAARVVEIALKTIERHAKTSREERESVRRQRLEAIGLLAGSVAHDFNNLLQAFSGTADLLIHEPLAPEEQHEYFELLQSLSETGAELVSSLLVFSRHEKVERQPLDMAQLLRRFLRTVAQLTPSNIEFLTEIDSELGVVNTVASDVEQVFLNLYNNAVSAMPDGGTLRLTACLLSGEERIRIELTDSGCGMSQAVLERATEPFFTTKSAEEGTGLGLAMVHAHMQQSGGKLELTSSEGQGTTVALEYPKGVQAVQTMVERSDEPMVGGTESILVVEDDAIVRRVTCSFLTAAGYRVLSAPHGEAALALHRELPAGQGFELLVTDAIMPHMGGRALYEELCGEKQALPVIICSGYSRGTLAAEFFDAPDRRFLPKPFSRSQLLGAVRSILDAKT